MKENYNKYPPSFWFGLLIIILIIAHIIFNEHNKSYEKHVEEMHEVTASKVWTKEKAVEIYQPASWSSSNPTNTPICK